MAISYKAALVQASRATLTRYSDYQTSRIFLLISLGCEGTHEKTVSSPICLRL
jgi:hypothetical protein